MVSRTRSVGPLVRRPGHCEPTSYQKKQLGVSASGDRFGVPSSRKSELNL